MPGNNWRMASMAVLLGVSISIALSSSEGVGRDLLQASEAS